MIDQVRIDLALRLLAATERLDLADKEDAWTPVEWLAYTKEWIARGALPTRDLADLLIQLGERDQEVIEPAWVLMGLPENDIRSAICYGSYSAAETAAEGTYEIHEITVKTTKPFTA